MEILQEFVHDSTVLMAGFFSEVHFLRTMLLMSHLAASEHQAGAEKRALEQYGVFLKAMQANLQQAVGLLAKLDAEGYRGTSWIQKATSTLHAIQAALSEKECLQKAVDLLKPYGCCMFETRAGTHDVRIQNNTWLRKITLTHKQCEILMKQIDLWTLAKNGDIVWQMPCDWTFTVTSADGQRVKYKMAENEKLYVGFFDIGLLSDGVLHRLHLRADANKAEARQTGEALAYRLQDVIRRCTAYVRMLDYPHTSFDVRFASVPSQAYSLHVWAAPYNMRQELQRIGQQKRARTLDNSSNSGAGGLSEGSGW